MSEIKPHYLLFCDGGLVSAGASQAKDRGRWRFVLEHVATGEKIEATDTEPTDHPDRTALLAVMRGLEALEQPSRVTLITTSRYAARGLQYGLSEWRENDYCWEHFGSVQPIRNAELWKRVDGALRFHEVQCRWMAQDVPNGTASELESALGLPTSDSIERERPVEPSVASDSAPPIAIAERRRRHRRVGASSSPRTQEEAGTSTMALEKNIDGVEASQDEALLLAPYPCSVRATSRILLPVRWAWGTILALDTFLVSCVRCLLLMDPRRDHFKPWKF